jgi:hypothetical protein
MASKERNYEVGYGKPPKHTQFKKGQSGNPKGRRKAPRALDFIGLLRKSMSKKVKVRIDGDVAYFSKLEAGAEQLANKLASGDIRTIRMVLPLIDKIDELDKAERDSAGDGSGRSDAHRKLAEMLGLEWRPEDEAGD